VLREAVALGANHVEAFANSPPWWMTVSGSVTGATNSHSDNLQTSYETPFANYLATVVSNLAVLDGIHFDEVTPMNEPEGPWGYGGGQEGCHMDSGQQARMVNDLSAALSSQKLAAGIDAPETYDEPDAATAINAYGSATNYVTLLTAHAYGTKNPASFGSLAASQQKPAWISEYGDGDGSGISMARRIHDDITGADVCGWVYWQVVDNGSGWGFLLNPLDDEVTTNYTINEKFYVMGQFSEYIRPGFQIINVNDNYSLAAFNPANQTLIIVAVNDTSTNLAMNYNLSGFASLPATVSSVRTSATENQVSQPAISVTNKSFSTTLIPKSVTTFILNNVSQTPLPSPWATSDIGAVGVAGGATWTNGLFTVKGSGANIWYAGDEFRYVYQAASGDCSIQAEVLSVQNTASKAKAGVMIRETLNTNSAMVTVALTPSAGMEFLWRTNTAANALSADVTGVTAPAWVKVARTGNSFVGYYSTNGTVWTAMATNNVSITMATNVYIGMAVCSLTNSTTCTATFTNVIATP
jgi:O-glycosyl hydrolase